jgi:alpha-1,3-glucanase-like protein
MRRCDETAQRARGPVRFALKTPQANLQFAICATWFREVALLAVFFTLDPSALAASGAAVPWTRYEAETMTINGGLIGPGYTPGLPATEASGRRFAQLNSTGQYVQFTAQAAANALVIRYSVPDSADGTGFDSTLSLYTNAVYAGKLAVTSRYSWLYGAYPFTNLPAAGSPRNFFDEARLNGLSIQPGGTVRLQRDATDTASSYIIDLVELESVPAPISQPPGSLSIINYGAQGNGVTDDTAALNSCIVAARSQGKTVWLPSGTYKITASIDIPGNLTIQGAGMWYTTLVGDPLLYTNSSRRVALNGSGSNIHLSDFSILGRLNYRNDSEPNDGLVGSYGSGSSIARVWVEHTKTGAWIVNSQGLVVDGCRFRDTLADGINLCVGMQGTLVTNCTTRGTGDDCFAIWPANYTAQIYSPGSNVITHCTAQCPFLANGGAVYGGTGNRIEDCLFQDMPYGCGILFSTTFPVAATFNGTTVAQRCDLDRCGGYEAGYQWRAAAQLCMDNYNGIAGVYLSALNITNSISDGLSIIGGAGALSNARAANVSIRNYGIGASGSNALWAEANTRGSLTLSNCAIPEYRNDSAAFAFNFVTATPSPQAILGLVVSSGGTATLTYATTPGFSYHIESTTTLAPPAWAMVSGSSTNAIGNSVTFNDLNPFGGKPLYYRTASP